MLYALCALPFQAQSIYCEIAFWMFLKDSLLSIPAPFRLFSRHSSMDAWTTTLPTLLVAAVTAAT